ncbi:hypothetical protein PTKIN_Ptkin05aG0094000 [Pterospermum kingtungense]
MFVSFKFDGDLVTASPDTYKLALGSDAEFVLLASDGPIIGAFVKSRSVAEKGYLEEGYLMLDKVRSESRLKRGRGLLGAEKKSSVDVQ